MEKTIVFDDVGMIEKSLNFEFPGKLDEEILIDDLLSEDNLQCEDEAGGCVSELKSWYLAKNTLPNLPSPSRLMILKFSLLSPFLVDPGLTGDLVLLALFLMKDGKVFSDL